MSDYFLVDADVVHDEVDHVFVEAVDIELQHLSALDGHVFVGAGHLSGVLRSK